MDTESHELIAAYALDALGDDDRRRVEELLEVSAEAREELRSFVEVGAALATATTAGAAPSPDLRDRILAAARAEAQVVVPFERPAARRARLVPILSATTAIAATVALGLGLWATSLNGELGDTRSALAHERNVGTVLADPTARTVSLQQTSGKLVVDGAGAAVLVVDGIELAPAGKTYEVWVIDGDVANPAGLFRGGSGRAVVPLEHPVSTGSVVAVTVEDAAGAPKPTSAPIVTSSRA
ncbi:MAG: anti-sigma factor [Gaiellales bacterium]